VVTSDPDWGQQKGMSKMKSKELIGIEDRLGAKNYKPLDVILSKGQGIWVWDVDGKKYMDCLSAY
jgi:ornithine--oxo-acid transaminase